jgi:hypothetical protein
MINKEVVVRFIIWNIDVVLHEYLRNRVCLKIVKIFFVTMYLWQAPTNQKEKMRLISIWCSPYVNWFIFQSKLLKPEYFAQNYFVIILYIWAKRIRIWSIFLGAQTSIPFKLLELLVLNQRGSCLKTTFILKCFLWWLVIVSNCLVKIFSIYSFEKNTMFINVTTLISNDHYKKIKKKIMAIVCHD